MADAPRCATCKHWSLSARQQAHEGGDGTCEQIDDWDRTPSEHAVPFIESHASGEAIVVFRTPPTFGCVLHEVKS